MLVDIGMTQATRVTIFGLGYDQPVRGTSDFTAIVQYDGNCYYIDPVLTTQPATVAPLVDLTLGYTCCSECLEIDSSCCPGCGGLNATYISAVATTIEGTLSGSSFCGVGCFGNVFGDLDITSGDDINGTYCMNLDPSLSNGLYCVYRADLPTPIIARVCSTGDGTCGTGPYDYTINQRWLVCLVGAAGTGFYDSLSTTYAQVAVRTVDPDFFNVSIQDLNGLLPARYPYAFRTDWQSVGKVSACSNFTVGTAVGTCGRDGDYAYGTNTGGMFTGVMSGC